MVAVGDKFVLTKELSRARVGGYGRSIFPKDSEVVITRVNSETYWVKGTEVTHYGESEASISVLIYEFDTYVKPVDPNAPKPRALGEVPEGMIGPDDPRIAWLWDDAAKFATQKGYCEQYDKLADALDIPGRERNFTVVRNLDGLEVSVKVKARSRKLAEALLAEKLPM